MTCELCEDTGVIEVDEFNPTRGHYQVEDSCPDCLEAGRLELEGDYDESDNEE